MSGAGVVAFVGLGSNLEQPQSQLRRAIDGLDAIRDSRVEAFSSFYGNPPMGPQDQPDFVNAVVRMTTSLGARALLAEFHRIERRQGRIRGGVRWGPRTIDLDLLTFGEQRIDEPGLQVPHPGIVERAFVLVPLAELAPDLEIPGAGAVRDLLVNLGGHGLERLQGTHEAVP